jgi:HlyD family secretion protein
MTQTIPAWQAEIEAQSTGPSLRRVALASAVIIAIGFGGFFVWAFVAQLDMAIPAMGSIVVESKRKTLSILDPGILTELYVKEGDRVEAGQPLLRLDEAQLNAQLGSLKVQYMAALAKTTRLRAEQSGQRDVQFPQDLVAAAAGSKIIADIVANESKSLKDRWAIYDATVDGVHKQIAQLGEQISALKAQIEATQQQLAYSDKELVNVTQLANKGLATEARLYDLQRIEAGFRAQLGQLAASQATARQAVAQTELQIVSADTQRQQDISTGLQDAQGIAGDAAEKIRGIEDLLTKKVLVAPEAGTVTNIQLFTPGASIGAGQAILDLVPQNDKMIVEAKVRPDDIEHVHPGQKVNIRLTAYKQRRVPVLTGQLVYVAADAQQDQSGVSFILARAEIDHRELSKLKDVALYPGMPAEVLIIGGERAAIDYFISPITDSLHRALDEE